MEWFGWLTKGHYQVTLLDRLTGVAEVFVVLGVAYGLLWTKIKFNRWQRKRRSAVSR